MSLPSRRRFWAPEVVQTSAMDCGPAALKCVLEGFGTAVSYGRLREACQTSVDGTSIDTLEEIALALRLDAAQLLLPAEHALGETGWQLSHGERSRLFVARSLLQVLQARVLDESFAALDPETLDEVMGAVLRRPEALLVIAHP